MDNPWLYGSPRGCGRDPDEERDGCDAGFEPEADLDACTHCEAVVEADELRACPGCDASVCPPCDRDYLCDCYAARRARDRAEIATEVVAEWVSGPVSPGAVEAAVRALNAFFGHAP